MKDIHDIKSPIELFFNYLPYVIGSLILLSLIMIFTYLSFKKNTQKPLKNKMENLAKKLSARDLALNELEKIKKEKLIELNRIELFYNRLTEILKNYLVSEYTINTQTKTTKEIVSHIERIDINNDLKNNLEQCLKNYDYAKYSGYKVNDGDMNESFDLTYLIFK